jgi:SAM-dependent methyltransferase
MEIDGKLSSFSVESASPLEASSPIRSRIPQLSADALGRFLSGDGIEIGALHEPLGVSNRARVRYVDRTSVAELRIHYPELSNLPLVPIDILDDGETLSSIGDDCVDFVIANHMLEHCEDPLGALSTFLRVVRPGGV